MAGALISEELEIIGDLICEGSVDVRGTIKGDVAAGKLEILSGGQLNGEVKAEEMVIHGDYSGNVTCATMLIHSEATVRSDIVAKHLSCESGADVEGWFHVDGGEDHAAASGSSKPAKQQTPNKQTPNKQTPNKQTPNK